MSCWTGPSRLHVRPGQAPTILIDEDVERCCRASAIEINTRRIHFVDSPSLTCRHDEIVSEKVVEGVESRLKVLRTAADCAGVIVTDRTASPAVPSVLAASETTERPSGPLETLGSCDGACGILAAATGNSSYCSGDSRRMRCSQMHLSCRRHLAWPLPWSRDYGIAPAQMELRRQQEEAADKTRLG